MSSFRRGKYGYKPFSRASKFRRTMRGRRMGKAPVSRAAYRVTGRGYHPFGQVGRPYSSIPQDYKSVDTITAPAQIITGPNAGLPVGYKLLLNGLQSGAAFYNRVGRQICMKSLEIQYQMEPTNVNAAATGSLRQRILIYYDRQPNNAAATNGQILANYDQAGTVNSGTAWNYPNPTTKDRFVILRDLRVSLPPLGINGAGVADTPYVVTSANDHAKGSDLTNALSGSMFISLKDLMVTYQASTGAIGDITTGALYIWFVNDDATVSPGGAWQVYVSARLRYIDC